MSCLHTVRPSGTGSRRSASMKIGINAMPLLGKSEGVKRYVVCLSRALAELEDVEIQQFGAMNTAVSHFARLPKVGFLHRQLEETVVDPMRLSRSVDLLHYTDTYGPLVPVRAPIVVTVHDTTFITHKEAHDAWVSRWLSWLAGATWPRAQAIIAVSQVTADDLQSAGVPAEKIHVIHHGIDHTETPKGPPPKGLVKGKYFAYLGNIEPRKDLPTLIGAFNRASARLPPDVELAIAGKHAWGPALPQFSVAGNRIKVLGWLSDEELSSLMAHSLAFVYPSRYEGFGLPPLEALHLGAQVIVGDTPVARETLGKHAQYFDPGDEEALAEQLLRAAADKGQSNASSREHTEAFTWRRAAQRTAELYKSILS